MKKEIFVHLNVEFSISDGCTQTGSYVEESEHQAQGNKKMAPTLPVIGQSSTLYIKSNILQQLLFIPPRANETDCLLFVVLIFSPCTSDIRLIF